MWLAQAASSEIHTVMLDKTTGRVHSVFNQSFNLQFGDRLVHIGSLDQGLAPFGIGLRYMDAQLLTKQVKAGQAVAWNKQKSEFVFLSRDTLSLQHAAINDLSLSYDPYDHETLQKHFEAISTKLIKEKWPTGIAQSEQDTQRIFNFLRSANPPPADSLLVKKLIDLQTLAQGGKISAASVFNYWIGRGAGLTPSGDDMLTGLSAMLSALGISTPFIEHLASYLSQYGSERTTQVGLEYLLYATDRRFHAHLVHLCQRALKLEQEQVLTAVEDMKAMGHTSGTDTLLGILLGMKIQLSRAHD